MASYYEQTGQKELYQQQLDTLLLNKKVTSDTKISVMRQVIVENEQSSAKDSTQVIALFDRMMKQDIDDPQIPMLYSQYLLSKNMEQEAVPVLEQVVDLDPTNKAARLMLVNAAVKRKTTSKLSKSVNRVLKPLRMRWRFIIIWLLLIIRQNRRIVY